MYQNHPYTLEPSTLTGINTMAKKSLRNTHDFGKQLARLRKEAGYTQHELADEIGATRRMIAYYEAESEHPPTAILTDLAKTLKVSTDQLLGLQAIHSAKSKQPDSRLLRRLQQIDKLSAAKRKQIIQVIDTFIEHEQLKHKA